MLGGIGTMNAPSCKKCGEHKELVFASCVCADCSDALDRQWGGSSATSWLLTKREYLHGSWDVREYVIPNYAEAKVYWASDHQSRTTGFLRYRQPTPEELALPSSECGTLSGPSRGATIRPATSAEVESYLQRTRDWGIAADASNICREAREKLCTGDAPDAQLLDQASEEIAERLRQLGWFEDLLKMKAEENDALQIIYESADDARLFEMALQKHGSSVRRAGSAEPEAAREWIDAIRHLFATLSATSRTPGGLRSIGPVSK